MLAVPRMTGLGRSINVPATPSTSTFGTRLTASATPHAKGNYAQIIASTAYDVHGLTLVIAGSGVSATRTDMMLDLAIGAAASEVVILPEFLCGWRGGPTASPQDIFLPFFIPKGTRIAARLQSLIASDVVDVQVHLEYGSGIPMRPLFRRADAYGTSAASSIGTSHTPGNSGAESTDASIGSTLSRDYGAIMLQVQGTLANTTMTNIAYHWELRIGGATIAEWYAGAATTELLSGPFPDHPLIRTLSAGTQLQMRAEASGTAQAHDVAFYCFY